MIGSDGNWQIWIKENKFLHKNQRKQTDLVKKLTKLENSASKLLKKSHGFGKIGKDWIGDIQKLSLYKIRRNEKWQ